MMLVQGDLHGTEPLAAAATEPLVLIVDDEASVRKVLGILLRTHGMRAVEATSAGEALTRAAESGPDLVLLDLGLPDSDGIEVTRQLREWTSVPIVVISARGKEPDKVSALDAGANDYLTKPFAHGELLARIRVWLRATAHSPLDEDSSIIEAGELRIDLGRHLVYVSGREIHLTPTEYRLFAALMRNPDRLMTHRQLLAAAGEPRSADGRQYLRVYMGQLRRKLEPDSDRPRHLLTEPGVGYRLRPG
jgi:two-component system, OmpR family, KDP operon response regulator KdpE